jgi:ribosomal protein L37AE/L43A
MPDIEKFNDEQKKVITEILSKSGLHDARVESGSISEAINIEFKCSKTMRRFVLVFSRMNQNEKYKIVKTLKDIDFMGPKGSGTTVRPTTANINDFDTTDFLCPYCNDPNLPSPKKTFYKCGECDMLSCGGGVNIEGDKVFHTCPWCGVKGMVSGHIKNLTGTQHQHEASSLPRGQSTQQIRSETQHKYLPPKK